MSHRRTPAPPGAILVSAVLLVLFVKLGLLLALLALASAPR